MIEAYIPASDGGVALYYLFSILDYDYIPIVFIAKDSNGKLYFCDCVECRGSQQWTIAPTSRDTIQKVLDKKLSVYEALRIGENDIIVATYDYETETYSQKRVRFEELTDEDLPDKDSIINCPEPDAKEKFSELVGVSRETIIYSMAQMPLVGKEWNTNLGADTLGPDVTFGITRSIRGESKDDNHSREQEKIAFYINDLTAESKVLPVVYVDKQKPSINSIDNPDSPIAA